jgi:hypothetical protein
MRAIVLTERGVRYGVRALAEACRTGAHTDRLQKVLASFGEG